MEKEPEVHNDLEDLPQAENVGSVVVGPPVGGGGDTPESERGQRFDNIDFQCDESQPR